LPQEGTVGKRVILTASEKGEEFRRSIPEYGKLQFGKKGLSNKR